jgi:hypothetical protein
MNKISGILPSNRRIETIDRTGEQKLRSGHGATFGQKVSHSEVVRTAKPKLTLDVAPNAFERMSDRRKKDRMHAAIVERMSNEFFAKKVEPQVPETTQRYLGPASVHSQEIHVPRPNYVEEYVQPEAYGEFTAAVDQALDAELQAEGFNTVGSNLSVVA